MSVILKAANAAAPQLNAQQTLDEWAAARLQRLLEAEQRAAQELEQQEQAAERTRQRQARARASAQERERFEAEYPVFRQIIQALNLNIVDPENAYLRYQQSGALSLYRIDRQGQGVWRLIDPNDDQPIHLFNGTAEYKGNDLNLKRQLAMLEMFAEMQEQVGVDAFPGVEIDGAPHDVARLYTACQRLGIKISEPHTPALAQVLQNQQALQQVQAAWDDHAQTEEGQRDIAAFNLARRDNIPGSYGAQRAAMDTTAGDNSMQLADANPAARRAPRPGGLTERVIQQAPEDTGAGGNDDIIYEGGPDDEEPEDDQGGTPGMNQTGGAAPVANGSAQAASPYPGDEGAAATPLNSRGGFGNRMAFTTESRQAPPRRLQERLAEVDASAPPIAAAGSFNGATHADHLNSLDTELTAVDLDRHKLSTIRADLLEIYEEIAGKKKFNGHSPKRAAQAIDEYLQSAPINIGTDRALKIYIENSDAFPSIKRGDLYPLMGRTINDAHIETNLRRLFGDNNLQNKAWKDILAQAAPSAPAENDGVTSAQNGATSARPAADASESETPPPVKKAPSRQQEQLARQRHVTPEIAMDTIGKQMGWRRIIPGMAPLQRNSKGLPGAKVQKSGHGVWSMSADDLVAKQHPYNYTLAVLAANAQGVAITADPELRLHKKAIGDWNDYAFAQNNANKSGKKPYLPYYHAPKEGPATFENVEPVAGGPVAKTAPQPAHAEKAPERVVKRTKKAVKPPQVGEHMATAANLRNDCSDRSSCSAAGPENRRKPTGERRESHIT